MEDPLRAIFGVSASELFEKRELFATHGPLERFPSFMRSGPMASVDSLCRHYQGPLEVAQGRAGKGIQVPVRDAHAAALLRLGLTVYFTDLGRSLPESRGFLRGLEAALGLPECATLAAFTNAAGSGLSVHHDRYDQLFFQVRGRKEFRHAPNGYVENPDIQFGPYSAALPEFGRTYRLGFPQTSEEILERDLQTLVLEPGSAFFMPAGTWHTTAEQTEESLSIVIAVRAPSRLEVLLNALAYYAGQSPAWRARPYGAWSTADSARAEHETFAELLSELGKRLPGLGPEHAFGAWSAHGYTIGTFAALPRTLSFERFIRLPNSTVRCEPGPTPGKLHCLVESGPTSRPPARVELSFNVEARPVLDWVLALGRAFTVDEASERFPEFRREELAELFGLLAEAALIRPLPAPEWEER